MRCSSGSVRWSVAGIFALLGEAGKIAGAGVWISFLVAGPISVALGYAVAKFGAHQGPIGGDGERGLTCQLRPSVRALGRRA